MRKLLLSSITTSALLLMLCASSYGDIITSSAPAVGDSLVVTYTASGSNSSGGGPFIATATSSDGVSISWKTYCVEGGDSAEYIDIGKTYTVSSLTSSVAESTGNTVTDAAKWLYYQSLHNPSLLAGFTDGNSADEASLQNAIWYSVLDKHNDRLLDSVHGDAKTWYKAAAAAVKAGWSGDGLVGVLNPVSVSYDDHHGGWGDHGGGDWGSGWGWCEPVYTPAQSILYEIGTLPVPEPSTFVLLAAAIIGVTTVARRRG